MKNKKIKVLIILFIILILLVGVVYAVTDLFKSPKKLFYKYLISGNLENVSDINYDEFLDNIKDKKSYISSGKIKCSMESNKEEYKYITELLGKLDLTYNSKVDLDKQNNYFNIKTNYNKNEMLNLELLKNKSVVGIREKNYKDEYISIDLSKLKETLEKFEMDTSEISNLSENYNLYNLFYISKEDRNTIINTYKDILDKEIDDKNYSVRKNIEIEVNGNKYKCNAYKLSITSQEINDLYIKVLETLKSDELTLNIIVEKYNMSNIVGNSITKQKLVKEIQKEINRISSESLKNEKIDIIVYENNSKTIRTEIIKENENIVIDVTKTKENLTTLIKINMKDIRLELLFNMKTEPGNDKIYKIIYNNQEMKLKIDITESINNISDSVIEELNEKNSNNISEMNDEEIQAFSNELITDISLFIFKKINSIGLANEILPFLLENQNF